MSVEQLITAHLDIWTAADTEKKSGRGRSSGNAGSVYGIKKLRELILCLAISGRLLPQHLEDVATLDLMIQLGIKKKVVNEVLLNEFPIPDSWQWLYISDLCNLKTGGTIRWLVSGDIHENEIYDCKGRITESGLENSNCKILPKNSVLIALNGQGKTRATVAVLKCEAACNQSLVAMIQKYENLVLPKFLWLNLKYRYSEIRDITGQNQRRGLNMGLIGDLSISVPPIAEQNRIIAKVDELLALCDQLENQHNNAAEAHEKLVTHLLGTLTQSQNAEDFNTNWQRISVHFDTLFTTEASIDALKQTLLQLAVMGKLVPQDPNDEPASELLKRIQTEKAKLITDGKIKKDKPLAEIADDEKPFDLPVGWEWVRLGDISSTVQYGYTDSADHNSKEVLFLRITDIQDDAVNWDTVPGCSISIADSESYALQNNDLVIARTGGTIGKSYLVDGLNQKAVFASYLIRIGNLSSTSAEYKKVFLGSKLYWAQLIASSMGTGQPNVNGTALKNLIFSLPPLYEQDRIVTKVDELMILCDQLKVRITSSNQLQQKLADVMTQVADC